MLLIIRSILFVAFLWSTLISYCCDAGNMRVTSVDLVRPVVEYVNNTFGQLFNITSRRLSRQDPLHYVQLCYEVYLPVGNNVTVDIHIDELLSNTYRPTFVVASLKLCVVLKMMAQNLFYARNVSESLKGFKEIIVDIDDCVLSPGIYDVKNLAWPLRSVPENFPFEKGRFHIKFRMDHSTIANVYLDMEMKMLPKMRCRRGC